MYLSVYVCLFVYVYSIRYIHIMCNHLHTACNMQILTTGPIGGKRVSHHARTCNHMCQMDLEHWKVQVSENASALLREFPRRTLEDNRSPWGMITGTPQVTNAANAILGPGTNLVILLLLKTRCQALASKCCCIFAPGVLASVVISACKSRIGRPCTWKKWTILASPHFWWLSDFIVLGFSAK